MLKNKDKIDFFEKIFINCYIILLCAYWFLGLVNNTFSIAKNIIICLGFISFVFAIIVKFLQKKINIKEKENIIFALFSIFTIIIYINSGKRYEGLLCLCPTLLVCKNYDVKKIIKTIFFTYVLLFLFVILLTITKVLPYSITQKEVFGKNINIVNIAMMHGNISFAIIFIILSSYLYGFFEKIDLKRCAILQIILIVAYFCLYSRTGFICSSLIIWITYLVKTKKIQYKNKVIQLILKSSSFIVFAFIIVMISAFYGTNFFNLINKLISYRIMEAYVHINEHSVSLFPRDIKYSFICDNSQTVILLSFGILYTISLCIIYYITIKRLLKEKRNIEVTLLVTTLFYSYSEFMMSNVFPNFSLIFLGICFFGKYFNDEEIKNSNNSIKNTED